MQVMVPTDGVGNGTLHHGARFCWEVAEALTIGTREEEGVLVGEEPRWDCGREGDG